MNNNEKGNDDVVQSSSEILQDELKKETESFTREEISKSMRKVNQKLLSIDLELIESKMLSRKEQLILIKQYFKKKFFRDIAYILLSSFITTLVFDFFINSTGKTGNFSFGLGTICKFLAILTYSDIQRQSSFFFLYFFVLNIPLIIFGFYKLGSKFTVSTMTYMLLQIVFDQILQRIPYFNPSDFNIIIDYQVISLNSPWAGCVFLFIFSIVAGLLLGYSYSILYRIGSSTGGTDFVVFYFSIKKNKPIGNVSRNLNVVILMAVIILNTVLFKGSDVPIIQKYSILSHYSIDDAKNYILSDGKSLFDSIIAYNQAHGQDATIITNDDMWKKAIVSALDLGYGNELSGSIMWRIKTLFIFGPSLFASLCGVVVQALVINWLYPRYKVRTYLVTTKEPNKLVELLSEKGYNNDIVSWNVESLNLVKAEQKYTLSVTMLVLNWKLLEKSVFLIDPEVRIISLKTAFVKGFFNLETASEEELEKRNVKKEIEQNQDEIKKVKESAIQKASKQKQKYENELKKLSLTENYRKIKEKANKNK